MIEFPRIVFDVDNVLADSMSIFCRKASELLGYEVDKKHIQNHKVVGSIPLSPRTIFRLQSKVWSDWENLSPTEPDLSKKMLAFKRMEFEIYIATAIPLRLASCVKKWIKSTNIPFNKFFCCSHEFPKSQIQADALVDDSPEEIKHFVRKGRMGFLYLQPWNVKSVIRKAIIVKNIDDVLRYYGTRKGKDGLYRNVRWFEKT